MSQEEEAKKRIAIIVSIQDLEALETIEARIDLEDARKALVDAKKNGIFSWEEIKRNLGL